ncbi:hypothetical protein Ssi03_33490 [Sphaerisporangium siamense]|uniref:DUF2637 domain-containing protein n=1 Tax=Sphaerisporangium siamense TaxID=795645 RepID=A0A7W7D1L0_9ACTN|nr:DUF2637 domain-containing protein [Sphaerisporangium siamense]MBB4698582.1 hypothetical protein [Sphaerisporangium siamense]GII85359.1 hypothetical protein Ssi03_33490 [Sphaerisporangium siamense]
MDVTPPLPAARSSRRSEIPPAQQAGAALALRRVGTAVAALAVAGLAATACVLSFEPIRSLAVTGGARADFAYLYPAGFDALLAIALISVLLLRPARLLVRAQAMAILALLIVAAAAANIVVATGTVIEPGRATVPVAVAPWVMFVIGLWLFLLPARRFPAYDAAAAPPAERDIVPFGGEERDPELAPPLETASAASAHPARDHGPATTAAEPDEPEITPVVPPTAAPETPTVDELPPLREDTAEDHGAGDIHRAEDPHDEPRETGLPETGPRETGPRATGGDEPYEQNGPEQDAPKQDGPEHGGPEHGGPEHGGPEHVVPPPEPEQRLVPQPRPSAAGGPPERSPDRPIRWGDLVRPASGDVLVHPLPKPSERDLGDTQPYPQVTDREPERDEAPAQDEPRAQEQEQDTQPYPHLREEALPGTGAQDETPEAGRRPQGGTAAPPSGRMRSTPLPPEE